MQANEKCKNWVNYLRLGWAYEMHEDFKEERDIIDFDICRKCCNINHYCKKSFELYPCMQDQRIFLAC